MTDNQPTDASPPAQMDTLTAAPAPAAVSQENQTESRRPRRSAASGANLAIQEQMFYDELDSEEEEMAAALAASTKKSKKPRQTKSKQPKQQPSIVEAPSLVQETQLPEAPQPPAALQTDTQPMATEAVAAAPPPPPLPPPSSQKKADRPPSALNQQAPLPLPPSTLVQQPIQGSREPTPALTAATITTGGAVPPSPTNQPLLPPPHLTATASTVTTTTAFIKSPPSYDPVDTAAYIQLATTSDSVAALRDILFAKFPGARGRGANKDLRDLYHTMMTNQPYTTRAQAVPRLASALWALAGKEPEAAGIKRRTFCSSISTAAVKAVAVPAGQGEGPCGDEVVAAVLNRVPSSSALVPPSGSQSQQQQQPEVPELIEEDLTKYPPEIIRLACLAKEQLALPYYKNASFLMLLETGLLNGKAIAYKVGSTGEVLLKGSITKKGEIKSEKSDTAKLTLGEFETLAGEPSPADPNSGVCLEPHGTPMRTLLNLVNKVKLPTDGHMENCYKCHELGGDMLNCDGCTASYHLSCAGIDEVPENDWFCPACEKEGRTTKRIPVSNQARAARAAPGMEDGGAGARSRGGRGRGRGRGGGGYRSAGPSRLTYTYGARRTAGRPGGRNMNRHKRLFEGEEGGLLDGQPVFYRISGGKVILKGVVVINHDGVSGIKCGCCDSIISASQFESHAGQAQRRQPYEHIYTESEGGVNLKAVAALLPDLPPDPDAIVEEQEEENGVGLDSLSGGCVLCREPDFQRGEFGPRTVIYCDQCEREFHVGCLEKRGLSQLQALPQGDWFCDKPCRHIWTCMKAKVLAGQMPVAGYPEYTLEVLNGKDGNPSDDRAVKINTALSIRKAAEILKESFDPIIDYSTNRDLLPLMLYARQYGDWDYRNVYTLLLRQNGVPVVAGIVRVFNAQFAELPLIATKMSARRQGHAKIMLQEWENMLIECKVHTLVLPAAHETVETWKTGFHFEDMPPDQLKIAKSQLKILIFPGTEVLWKQMPGVAMPIGHHVLRELHVGTSDEEVATVLRQIVNVIAANAGEHLDADGKPIPPPPKAEIIEMIKEGGEGEEVIVKKKEEEAPVDVVMTEAGAPLEQPEPAQPAVANINANGDTILPNGTADEITMANGDVKKPYIHENGNWQHAPEAQPVPEKLAAVNNPIETETAIMDGGNVEATAVEEGGGGSPPMKKPRVE